MKSPSVSGNTGLAIGYSLATVALGENTYAASERPGPKGCYFGETGLASFDFSRTGEFFRLKVLATAIVGLRFLYVCAGDKRPKSAPRTVAPN